MIAELKNSKSLTMQEDATAAAAIASTATATTTASVAATVPSTVIVKDERISSASSAAAAAAVACVSAGVGAVASAYLQPRHVVLKDESESGCGTSESAQTSYKRKLMFALGHDDDEADEVASDVAASGSGGVGGASEKDNTPTSKRPKLCVEREQMFELFQPWALKTYGDQAKTKTITLRKKARILKALEGKEHSRPDSSKFRFWVKSKAFTTKRPECFQNAPDYPASSNTEYPNNIDLYVASTTKDFGQRTYRKVAVVEEFFNIIYNIHVEMGGRSGRHAGQKRTYRIITETYAFLPREAVTRFLSACPECKKNLRPLSPGRSNVEDDGPNESSTEIDVLNYSPQTDSSLEIVKPSTPTEDTERIPVLRLKRKSHNRSPVVSKEDVTPTSTDTAPVFTYPSSSLQKIRINPVFQTQSFQAEPISNVVPSASAAGTAGVASPQMNFGMLNRESLIRYYDFMRRLYGHSMQTQVPPASKPEIEVKPPSDVIDLASDERPTTSSSAALAMRSKSVQQIPQTPIQQACAINLSKPFFSNPTSSDTEDRPIEEPKQVPATTPRDLEIPVEEHETQLDLRRMKPTTLTYPQLPRSMRQSDNEETKQVPAPATGDLEKATEEHETQLDLRKVKPITSTYLQLTRSMGLSDADALKFDDLEPPMPTPPVPDTASDGNTDDPYAGLMKDADKLKLMLLAWNYQNSNAVRNGTEGPDLGVVGGLWAQYQNALAQNATKIEPSNSPVPRAEESSPVENQDETNSSGQKEEDEGSEDDSDDKMAQDPERLKAFNMFVRLFVDENLDRIIPISKQPKEKIQAIIDSCARQFPEFGERSRKRIRTYLKSCRRNKKAREGWDNTTRPTPAHLTSVQAEQILAIACENESMNAKRMRIGLDPITQAVPLTTTTSTTSTAVSSDAAATSTPFTSGFRSTPSLSTSESEVLAPTATSTQGPTSSARSSPLALSTTSVAQQPIGGGGPALPNGNTTVSSVGTIPASSPLYRPTDFTSPTSTSPYAARTPAYPSYFPAANATPTDLSMKPSSVPQQPTQSITSTAAATSSSLSPNTRPPPPLVTHKLSTNEITAARQVITAYRESAAFLLRTADQVEQLLVQQQ